MIGRVTEADQTIGHRITVNDVDAGRIAVRFGQCFGRVKAGGTRSYNREMPHTDSPCFREEA